MSASGSLGSGSAGADIKEDIAKVAADANAVVKPKAKKDCETPNQIQTIRHPACPFKPMTGGQTELSDELRLSKV